MKVNEAIERYLSTSDLACGGCGTSLRGSKGITCGACGWVIVLPHPEDYKPDELVGRIKCAGCEYDLSSLGDQGGGVCPECGRRVSFVKPPRSIARNITWLLPRPGGWGVPPLMWLVGTLAVLIPLASLAFKIYSVYATARSRPLRPADVALCLVLIAASCGLILMWHAAWPRLAERPEGMVKVAAWLAVLMLIACGLMAGSVVGAM